MPVNLVYSYALAAVVYLQVHDLPDIISPTDPKTFSQQIESIMQHATDQAEASIPMETVRESPNYLNYTFTFTVRRKAAKRSEFWYRKPPPQNIAAPLSLPLSLLPARKKARLGEPFLSLPATSDEAVRKTAIPDMSVGFPPPGADRTGVQCRHRWIRTLDPSNGKGKWKPEEDAKLTEAVKKHGSNWVAVAAMVSGRTNEQCRHRWTQTLDPSIGKGKWKPKDDTKLTGSSEKYGNNWVAVAAMVFGGRTNQQCRERWVKNLDPVNGRIGNWKPEDESVTDKQPNAGTSASWTREEVAKLTSAIETHSGWNWNWGLGRNSHARSGSNEKSVSD
jgi:hypothetical protein